MRDLFEVDLHDYDENGEIMRRPSARAVVIHGDKVLVVHSKKYNYYKFPGGGIRAGETHEETVIREVQEEIGYVVKPDSFREYGRVIRKQKDAKDEKRIFLQENFYYFCEVEDEVQATNQDDYEHEEGFEAEWVDPWTASMVNQHHTCGGDPGIIAREARVLLLLDQLIRNRV